MQTSSSYFHYSNGAMPHSTSGLVRVLPSESFKLNKKENLVNLNGLNQALNDQRVLKLAGYVGFDRLAAQYVNKQVKNGFAFNVLCIGETGIGKSTLMETLFNTTFNLKPSSHTESKVCLQSNTYELVENNIRLKLTLIETSGYGDQINKENSHEEIVKYIEEQFESYVQEELNVKRLFRQVNDTRVHACLYFVSPTGHSLKAIDLCTMRALDGKCNIIPIIAKADTISKTELADFKTRIMKELSDAHVSIYKFPTSEQDPGVNSANAAANALFPLAVIGSMDLVKVGNKLTRGRLYEWGTVSIENESHCDFLKFRDMILSTNMFDLIESTHVRHYQTYRCRRMKEIGFGDEDILIEEVKREKNGADALAPNAGVCCIQDVYNKKKCQIAEEISRKEQELKESFVKKVKDKEQEIRELEKELNDKYNAWKKEQLEWTDRLESRRKELEDEMKEFSERKFTLERSKFSTLNLSSKQIKQKK